MVDGIKINPSRYKVSLNGKTIEFEISGKKLNIYSFKNQYGNKNEFIFQGSKPEMVSDIGAMLQEIGRWAGEYIETHTPEKI